MRRNHYQLPTPYGGGSMLRPMDGQFAIYLPIESLNMVTNPSFENGSAAYTGYTVVNGALNTKPEIEGYFGVQCLEVSALAGADCYTYYSISLTNGEIYTFTLYIKGQSGISYTIGFYTAGNVAKAINTFVASGQWERKRITFTADATATFRLVFRDTGLSSGYAFLIDGVQCENLPYPTSYIDGDQRGFTDNGYFWTGAPHASTSIRSGQERHGGREIFLQNIGCVVQGYQGLSYQPIANEMTTNLFIAGSSYLGSISNERRITLSFRLSTESLDQVQSIKKQLVQLMDYSQTSEPQPFMLRYHNVDYCGRIVGETAQIPCVYMNGLEGITSNDISEVFDVQLVAPNPFVQYERDHSIRVEYLVVTDAANCILRRDSNGGLAVMGSATNGVTGRPWSMTMGPAGNIIIGGAFADADSVPNTRAVTLWNTATEAFQAIGTGAGVGETVYDTTRDFEGNIYVAGSFVTLGGVAGATYLARWNGGPWIAVSGGPGAVAYCCVVDRYGNIYVGGPSNNYAGINGRFIIKWDRLSSTWVTVGSTGGFDGDVWSLVLDADGETVYAFGSFSNTWGGGTALYGTAVLLSGEWYPLGQGFHDGTGVVDKARRLPSGDIIALGNDTTVPNPNVALKVYRGGQNRWENILQTFSGSTAFGSALYVDNDGVAYVGGKFTLVNGLTGFDWFKWNGTTIIPGDVLFPVAAVSSFIHDRYGNLYIGFSVNEPIPLGAAENPYDVQSDIAVYPVIEIVAESGGSANALLYQIGFEGGGSIYFKPYELWPNERITIICEPGSIQITSSTRGNIMSEVLPGSDFGRFILKPGSQIIRAFIDDTGSAPVNLNVLYHEVKASL